MPDEPRPEERTEPASPRRRQQFRERGEVARSRELASVAILFAAVGALYFSGPLAAARLARGAAFRFTEIHWPDLTPGLAQRVLLQTAAVGVKMILPILALVAVAALLAHVVQTGWLFAPKSLQPDLKRINPVGKFKQILFSSKTAYEAVKALLKIVVVGVPIWLAVAGELEHLPARLGADALDVVTQAGLGVMRIAAKVGAMLLVIALLDYGFQWWSLERRMRMTFQEAKEEVKEGEGDPHVRARRRRIAQEMSMNRMMTQVPQADVVVTNPTHFAVALKYDAGAGGAPRVVAKGQDLVAKRIREVAERAGVPCIENPPLARAIHGAVKLGKEIPPALYRAVAELLALVYRERGIGAEGLA